GFHIQPMADMAGPFANYTPTQFAAAIAPYLSAPGAYTLSDGRVVLNAFYAEAQSPAWWNSALSSLKTTYGLNVAFVPTFLDANNYSSNITAFAPISYGMGTWGGRNAAVTDPNSTAPGSLQALANQAHALGMIWDQSVTFQEDRPREGWYQ